MQKVKLVNIQLIDYRVLQGGLYSTVVILVNTL